MIAANARTKHLPRTAGQVGFARAATMLGACRLELASAASHLPHGLQPCDCGYERRHDSPGPGDA